MKAKLIVVGGTTSTTEVNLRLPAIIGRGRSAQVTIPHSLVSRQHCEVSERDGQLVVRDLDSLNGTYVGDERISEGILAPGALLTVGTVTFRAVYDVGNGDSCSDDGDDTCLDTSPIGRDEVRVADFETVPVGSPPQNESRLPPPVPARRQGSDEAETEQMSDLPNTPALESVSPNSD
ncbi:MAG: FHA domain-containing protein [Planctomycetia bacterium]|nr:FHA domain-containing protein [Planctomycetia bacterium]